MEDLKNKATRAFNDAVKGEISKIEEFSTVIEKGEITHATFYIAYTGSNGRPGHCFITANKKNHAALIEEL